MPIKDPEERRRKQREYSAKHYAKNKTAAISRVRERNRQKKAEWDAYKATLSCSYCGFNHPAAIDFHHTDPTTKIAAVHKLVRNRRFTAAYAEIKKCIVLCANCHRIHHHDERAKKKGPRRSP